MDTNSHEKLNADNRTSQIEEQLSTMGDGGSTATKGVRIRLIDAMVILAIVVGAGLGVMNRSATSDVASSGFAQGVDLTPLSATAVHADGRLRSFESHACHTDHSCRPRP